MMFVIAAQTYTSAIVTIIPEDHIFFLFVYICLLIYLFHTHTQRDTLAHVHRPVEVRGQLEKLGSHLPLGGF